MQQRAFGRGSYRDEQEERDAITGGVVITAVALVIFAAIGAWALFG